MTPTSTPSHAGSSLGDPSAPVTRPSAALALELCQLSLQLCHSRLCLFLGVALGFPILFPGGEQLVAPESPEPQPRR